MTRELHTARLIHPFTSFWVKKMFTLAPDDSKTPDVRTIRKFLGREATKHLASPEKKEDLSRRQAGCCSGKIVQNPYEGS